MKFNISKCFMMRVTQPKKYKVLYDYQLHSSTLSSVDHCKHLGVVLQSNLRWSKCIEAITAKANSKLSMIHRNIKKAPISVIEQIYKTLIRPQLEYVSCACMVTMVETGYFRASEVQCCAARFALNSYWPTASVTEMISTLNWET